MVERENHLVPSGKGEFDCRHVHILPADKKKKNMENERKSNLYPERHENILKN